MKNVIFTVISFFLALQLVAQSETNVNTTDRPNIVFIMSDDHAVSAVSAYNDWLAEIAPTPNIDRIADNGMLMTRTFNTNSICGPSRASILTSSCSNY